MDYILNSVFVMYLSIFIKQLFRTYIRKLYTLYNLFEIILDIYNL